MTDASPNPLSVSSDDSAEDTDWLADFLDWLDSSAAQRFERTSGNELVEQFLACCQDAASDEVRAMLREFARDNTSTGELAATAALDWIESPNESAAEDLPSDFGDYRLHEVIGRGGMGIVFRATQVSLGRPVCIKLAPVGMDERSRLVREARLAGELQHPNIVSIFDAGSQGGRTYIAMELVDGQPLSGVLASGPLGAIEAATMLRVICDAIRFAHERQILHRDLKPSNVIVDVAGRPRVTDFGLAKRLQPRVSTSCEQGGTETLTGIAGSPSYMSPEQVRDERLDVRTDVYGLGAVLYEMLSGRPPLVGDTALETMRLVESTSPIELGRLQVGLPKDLETICHKCLEKRPANRYRDVAELGDDLSRFLEGLPVHARPISRMVRSARWVNRNRSVSTAMGVVALSLLITMVGMSWMLSRTRSALKRTTMAEANQRELANELRHAVHTSNDALYRSLIAQATQALAANDVASARRSLQQIATSKTLTPLGRIEYAILRRQAWPAKLSVQSAGRKTLDVAWSDAAGVLVVLDDSGVLTTYSADGTKLKASEAIDAAAEGGAQLCIHPTQEQAILVAGDQSYQVALDTMEVQPMPGFAEPIAQIARHPQRSELIGLDERGNVWMLDLHSGKLRAMPTNSGAVRRFEVSPKGRFVAFLGGPSTNLAVWESMEPAIGSRSVTATSRHAIDDAGWSVDLRWAEESILLTLAENGDVNAYACSNSKEGAVSHETIWVRETELRNPESISVSDRHVLVIGSNEIVAISIGDGQIEWRHPRPPAGRICSSRSRPLVIYTDAESDEIRVWSTDRLAVPQIISTSTVPIRKLAVGNRGRTTAWRNVDGHITASSDAWPKPTIGLVETSSSATGIAMCPEQDRLAASRGNSVVIYELPQLSETVRVSDHESSVWSVAFSSDGHLIATGDSGGTVLVSDAKSGSPIAEFPNFVGDVRAIAFAGNDKTVFVADSSPMVKRCELSSGSVSPMKPISGLTIHAVAVLSNEALAIADSAGNIHVRNREDSSHDTQWTAHNGPVWSLVAIDHRILSAGQDGATRIWTADGDLLATFESSREPIWSIVHSTQTDRILGCTTAGNVFSIAW